MLLRPIATTSIRLNRLVLRQLSELTRTSRAEPRTEDDCDVFGSLSRTGRIKLAVSSAEKFLPEDEDGYDKEEYDLEPRKNKFYYKYEINKWARQGSPGLRRALELFHEMKSKARLQPTIFEFGPLIYGCARAGYTKRAFELYEESLKYTRKPTNSLMTCLINACAESPFPEYGLKRLEWLLAHLRVNFPKKTFNEVHYNSAIKAYGKLGRLDEASKLIKQMIDDNIFPTTDTFNMLFIGCASNEEAGSTLALRVYKRMRLYDIEPNLVTYRLLLRCIRDCGMGSRELIKETFNELPAMVSLNQRLSYKGKSSAKKRDKLRENFEWTPLVTNLASAVSEAVQADVASLRNKTMPADSKSKERMPPKGDDNKLLVIEQTSETMSLTPELVVADKCPNLLNDNHLELLLQVEALHMNKLRQASHRIMLFGGVTGFLETMLQHGCKPDNKTFTLLLGCISPTPESLRELHEIANRFEIKRDRLYYDQMILTASSNKHNKDRLDLALYFMEQMQLDGEKPNISTFEALSFACNNWRKARQLLDDIERSRFIMSDKIIHGFFEAALWSSNFHYLNRLIDLSRERDYSPSRSQVESLESCRLAAHERIWKQEKNLLPADARLISDFAIEEFDKFTKKLDNWLQKVKVLATDHPWAQFKIEDKSKSDGYIQFVKHFKALNKVKGEALKRGGAMGNLEQEARKLAEQA